MSLPIDAYTSLDWFKTEQKDFFAKAWVFAGVISDVQASGDYITVQAGAFPLAVIKLKDGTLAAYHNICRHRGATLLEGTGNTGKSLVCPYHRWTYTLQGQLKGMPNMAECFPDLKRAQLSLKLASIGEFQGLIFVNPDPAADFESWISPIRDKAWPHDLSTKDISEAAPLIYDLKCDWKIFIENAIDGYHLAYLHEATLGGPKPDKNIWERHGDHLVWYAIDEEGRRHSLPAKAQNEYKKYRTKPIKAAASPRYGGVYHLFPTTVIDASPYNLNISTLIPLEAGRCRMVVRQWVGPGQSKDERKYIPGYNAKTGIISSDNWTKPALETGDFQTEDVWICEKIQRGMNSPAFERGPLAKGAGAEDPISWFHDAIKNNA